MHKESLLDKDSLSHDTPSWIVDALYQLQEQQRDLAWLLVTWMQSLSTLPPQIVPHFTGPQANELAQVEAEVDVQLLEEIMPEPVVHDDVSEYQEFEDDDLDIGLIEYMDTLALTDANVM
jgi:hypothetical protein